LTACVTGRKWRRSSAEYSLNDFGMRAEPWRGWPQATGEPSSGSAGLAREPIVRISVAMTPLISVLMPVRNGARWLREAVDSVLDQELRDFELVIVDDGSDDDTVSLLERCGRGDDRVRVLRQPPQGIVAALNLGIAAARAPYLARLDADDVARRDRLAQQLAFIERHDRVDLVGSAAQVIDEGGAVIGRIAPPIDPGELARHLRRGNPIVHSSVMMRADAVRRSGGYRKAFGAAEDYDLWLRMAESGGIANLPERLVSLRRHDASVSRRNAVRQSFSVRLAQRSAAARRAGADDPAAALAEPPDWWATEAEAAFFGPEVGFYRFLDSDRSAAPQYVAAVERRLFDLNHVERKLAQVRLGEMLSETGSRHLPLRLRIAALIALLHPGRGLAMVWRASFAR
jgi:glycosyltransferase involved in cell wall biosynthesis